jgi:hypothetical protein
MSENSTTVSIPLETLWKDQKHDHFSFYEVKTEQNSCVIAKNPKPSQATTMNFLMNRPCFGPTFVTVWVTFFGPTCRSWTPRPLYSLGDAYVYFCLFTEIGEPIVLDPGLLNSAGN